MFRLTIKPDSRVQHNDLGATYGFEGQVGEITASLTLMDTYPIPKL